MGGSTRDEEFRIRAKRSGSETRGAIVWGIGTLKITITTAIIRVKILVMGRVINEHCGSKMGHVFTIWQLTRHSVLVLKVLSNVGLLWAITPSTTTGEVALSHSTVTDIARGWTSWHSRGCTLLSDLKKGGRKDESIIILTVQVTYDYIIPRMLVCVTKQV